MGRTFLLAAVLFAAVSEMLSASPALAQLAGDAPPPPEYEVNDDGTLVIGGDILVRCAEVGLGEIYLGTDDPEVRAQIDQSIRESAQACEAAGFETAVDLPSGSASASSSASASGSASSSSDASAEAQALPETGGLTPSGLLLAAGASLVAGCLLVSRVR